MNKHSAPYFVEEIIVLLYTFSKNEWIYYDFAPNIVIKRNENVYIGFYNHSKRLDEDNIKPSFKHEYPINGKDQVNHKSQKIK